MIDYVEDIDFSILKNDVGRPVEDVIRRIDLKPYMVEAEFKRRFNKFYVGWEGIIKAKAKGINRQKYVEYMEEYYGEVLEKFSGLGRGDKKSVLNSSSPLNILYRLTNLSTPNVFHNKADNEYFMEEVLKAEL